MSVLKNILLIKIQVSEKLRKWINALCCLWQEKNLLLLKIKNFQMISLD